MDHTTHFLLLVLKVVGVQQDHGAAGPERDRPPSATGGHPQPGLLLQGPHPRAEGQGAQGPVQLRPPGYECPPA